VLVPDPGYPSYSSVSKIVGAEVVTYNLKEENNWLPDFEELEQLAHQGIKVMWLNYPNMPTGANADKGFFKRLVEFAHRHKILLVNDNPYSFVLNEFPLSILSVPNAKSVAIELNSLSKSQNMAGWRMGCVAGAEIRTCFFPLFPKMAPGGCCRIS